MGIADEASDLIRRTAGRGREDVFDPATAVRTFRTMADENAAAIVGLPLAAAVRAAAGSGVRLALLQQDADRLGDLVTERSDIAFGSPALLEGMPNLLSRVILRDRFGSAVRRGDDVPQDLHASRSRPHVLVSGTGGGFDGPADRALAAVGHRRNVALLVQSYMIAVESVVDGSMVATLPKALLARFADRPSVFTPSADLFPFTLVAAWHCRADRTAAHRWPRSLLPPPKTKPKHWHLSLYHPAE